MNIKKNLIFHQKSKSISNKLSLKEFDFNSNIPNGLTNQEIYVLNNNNKDKKIEEQIKIKEKNNTFCNNNSKDKIEEINFVKTIDEMKQNILDLYYDKNSSFKKKIDELNLKFYLETEKYLNNFKTNDHLKNQKLQANLFIILFQQINIFIEEIERLNVIIIENKFKKEKIMQRTNDLIEKKKNILIQDNLIQSLKKSNTNTEKKLLETLIHEDKLIKDNERLRKENETYKTLTIVFENELKNSIKTNGLTPQKNKISRHIKTYSDYGVPSNSIINELVMHSNTNNYEEQGETMKNDSKYTTRDKKRSLYITKPINKEFYTTNKNNNSVNIDKKIKNFEQNNKIIKKNLIKFSPNNKQKQKVDNKIKVKKDLNKIINTKKIPIKNKNNNNLCYSFVYNSKHLVVPQKNKKINVIKKNYNGINLDSTSNNINSTINTNINAITETNNLSYEKAKDKNFKKIDTKKGYHKKQKTMSEISFNEIVRIQIINDELNNTVNKKEDNNKIISKKNSGKYNIKNSPNNKIHNQNKIKKNC